MLINWLTGSDQAAEWALIVPKESDTTEQLSISIFVIIKNLMLYHLSHQGMGLEGLAGLP